MAAEGQCDKTASDVGVWMKQSGGTEFFHVEKNSTNWHSLVLVSQSAHPQESSDYDQGTV